MRAEPAEELLTVVVAVQAVQLAQRGAEVVGLPADVAVEATDGGGVVLEDQRARPAGGDQLLRQLGAREEDVARAVGGLAEGQHARAGDEPVQRRIGGRVRGPTAAPRG